MNDEECEAAIRGWFEANLGARVTGIERQGRWRPAWYVDAEGPDGAMQCYVRGERTEQFLPYGLRREHAIHELLEKGGIRVPHIYGFIEELPGTVMARVEGAPNLGTSANEADRQSVLQQLAEQMASMHGLDTQPFADAGLTLPEDPRAVTLSLFQDFYDNYASRRKRPDPGLEFASQWVMRNAPPASEPARYAACDAGQFLFEGDRLTAMMDFELSTLSDPLMDLAAMRIRGQWEDLGNLPDFYRVYEQVSGRPVDLDKVRFHTAAFSLSGALASAICLEEFRDAPSGNADYVEYQSWVIWELKQALEAIGECMGVALVMPEMPAPATTRFSEAIFALKAALDSDPPADEIGAYHRRVEGSIADHLDLLSQYGEAFDAAYLADARRLLGTRVASTSEADRQLEELVMASGSEMDEALLRALHARTCNQGYLLAVPGSYYIKGLTELLLPI
ncbi:MAG: phosphotransferase [Novosphingobium sp.]|nr:phosphotransferase [Novosphingobium sp.]